MVEGRPGFALGDDRFDYGRKIIEHITGRYPQYCKAGSLQINLTQGINARLCIEFMHCAVYLNQKACGKACKVRNIPADGVLPSKFQTVRFRSECAPQ
jgi:hypothetical protein